MLPWQVIEQAAAPDGTILELRVRGKEYLIRADGRDLMSRADEVSSRALAELGCAHIDRGTFACVLVGGLGMGYTLRAALDQLGEHAIVEVAELVPAVARWNQAVLGALADHPLQDPRTKLHLVDVRARIRAARAGYHAILLDVDNGPDALAHSSNDALYGARGISEAWTALRPGGVFAIWSFSDDPNFTRRLERRGFTVRLQRVSASRKGRGRYHFVWLAMKAQHDG